MGEHQTGVTSDWRHLMSSPNDIGLHRLITETITTAPVDDPRDLAELVAKATPRSRLEAFYREALVGQVRVALSEQRNRALSHTLTPPATPTRSRKVAGIRDWWAELLSSRIHVGGQWKTIGECGVRELEFAAEERRLLAARVLARAAAYEQLRDLLIEHGVATVAELPADAVRDRVVEVSA